MKKKKVSEIEWYERFLRDFGIELSKKKQCPIPWYRFYLQNMKIDCERGKKFALKIKKHFFECLQETMTIIQELVLDNDIDTFLFQLEKEKELASSSTNSITVLKEGKFIIYI